MTNKEFLPNFLFVFVNPFFITRRYLYKNIEHVARQIGRGKLLDIGCGTKPYESFFQVEAYVGLDYRKEGKNQNLKADVFYDGGKFPFKKGEFDSALATEVLEHVFEPDLFMSEIYRILKPGGLCIMTVPFLWDEHEQPYDYARYTSFGLRALVEKHGFEVVEQIKTGNFVSALGQLFCTYLYYYFSRNRLLYAIARPLVFAPLQIFTLLFAQIFPKHQGLYLDNIILIKKKS
ncbi:MAG: class I SAM-dependent methyltransferase [Turneriella sp.]